MSPARAASWKSLLYLELPTPKLKKIRTDLELPTPKLKKIRTVHRRPAINSRGVILQRHLFESAHEEPCSSMLLKPCFCGTINVNLFQHQLSL
ncbi:hypothetical protein M8J77_026474 [Diaphorina citri]|nr:hypothetical protein M8J77_026474 [Diaphorina citri]